MANMAMTFAQLHGKSVAIWALRLPAAALFLSAAVMKLSGQGAMVVEFDQVGLGEWLRYTTGLLELTGAIAVLVPTVSIVGAAMLLLVDIGAFVAQVMILRIDWIHTVVIAIALVVLMYLQRHSLAHSPAE